MSEEFASDTPGYDGQKDSIRSWLLAVAAMREERIREGKAPPDPNKPHELRWAREGVVSSPAELDTVRNAEGA